MKIGPIVWAMLFVAMIRGHQIIRKSVEQHTSAFPKPKTAKCKTRSLCFSMQRVWSTKSFHLKDSPSMPFTTRKLQEELLSACEKTLPLSGHRITPRHTSVNFKPSRTLLQPLYNSAFAPVDLFSFSKVETVLNGRHFNSIQAIRETATTVLNEVPVKVLVKKRCRCSRT